MTNIYVLLSVSITTLVVGGIVGYVLGRYQAGLLEQIRTLQARPAEEPPKPEKPTVTGGAYQPPKQISNTVKKSQKAGLVETKTPEQLDWENRNELANLEHGS